VSNSRTQQQFIDSQAAARGLKNIEVVTADMNVLEFAADDWVARYFFTGGIMPILARTYGEDQARKWWVYWRVFFMACAEAWGFRGGREWLVSHYLFQKP